ncbi:MAG: phosphoribosylformylglycinamidine cyclo-ligase [Candidatus Cloacimonadota bacterium]|nr:MAG: phosphoribosylformylglycinamidine cyclo-ligase [Candidatus Cloacimonadota bacterium]PIE79156.1 MAG: phosphoribosylformylglycinamidine cyclo-ligase [Candidatus Delongbacteria bacterium]
MAVNRDEKYLKRGVSASKSEVHNAIKNVDKGIFPGAFCKVTEDHLTGSKDHCMIVHADGAGTKSSLAYLYYKESGDPSIFRGIAKDSLVMNLDDLLAVGADDNFLLSNTIGRNKNLISGEIISEIINGYEDVIDSLKKYGINIVGCGGETADVGDLVRTVIADSTLVTRMKRSDVIDNDNIKPGNVIVGLASFGKATYENEYNSGIGSNGLTSARHDTFAEIYREKYPESYSPETEKEYVYCGKYKLTDDFGYGLDVGRAILSPTRTYAPVLKEIFKNYRSVINGIVHNSGGGQVKCRSFGKGVHYIKDSLFDIPKVFELIKNSSDTSLGEMYQVFNMGSRMEIYIDEKYANSIIAISKHYGIDAKIVGRVEKNPDSDTENKVTIINGNAKFEY